MTLELRGGGVPDGIFGKLAGPNTWTGVQDFTGATVTGVGAGGSSDTTLFLPAPNGTDDVTAINTVLASASGKVVKGRPGSTYIVSTPITLPAGGNVVLDMTGCTIRLKSAATMRNLLVNAAVTPLRTVTDGAITTGTPDLTSATAAFTTADVGRYVKVAGAAVSGDLLVARISAYVSATAVTLDTSASTTVSGATLNVHPVDTDIELVGGYWYHSDNSSTALGTAEDHTIRIRFVDRLKIRNMSHGSLRGKYAISVAGVCDYLIADHQFNNTKSDGVHITGPAQRGVVRNLQGDTGDDLCSVTGQEPTGFEGFNDCIGAVKNLVIDNLEKKSGLSRVLHLCPGRSAWISNVTARNITGTTTSYGVYLWGDGAKAGSRLDNITIENVAIESGVDSVYINEVVGDRITVRNLYRSTGVNANKGVYVNNSTLDSLVVDGVVGKIIASGASQVLYTAGTTAIGELVMRRLRLTNTNSTNQVPILLTQTGVIGRFVLEGADINYTGPTTLIQAASATAAAFTNIVIDGCRVTSAGGQLIKSTTNCLSSVTLTDDVVTGMQWIAGDFFGSVSVYASNLRGTGITSGLCWARDTANVIINGDLEADTVGGNKTGSGTIRIRSLGVRADASVPNSKVAGDMLTNTNGALACGVGPVAYNGTAWVHLGSGATY